MLNYTFRLLLLVACLLTGLVYSQARELDLRKRADPDGTYSLSFCARPFPDSALSVPPHAFVAFSHLSATGKRFVRAIGTATLASSNTLLAFSTKISPIPAELEEQAQAMLTERCLTLMVNRAEYQHIMRLAETSSTGEASATSVQPISANYGLSAEGCVELFVRVITPFRDRTVALTPRGHSEPPLAYLRRVIDQNTPRTQ